MVVCDEDHLRRTLTITLIVGVWLTGFNQGARIYASSLSPELYLKVFLNFLTPFIVSNLGIIFRTTDHPH